MAGPVRNPAEAFQQLEAIMLRQMLQSSGAFRAGTTPGAQLRTDMFVETLAEAVAKAGGLGIAKMLEHQLGGAAPGGPAPHGSEPTGSTPPHGRAAPVPLNAGGWPRHAPAAGASLEHATISPVRPSATSTAAGIDDLDDPNSEAPLPEDPTADSIDDYQPVAASKQGKVEGKGNGNGNGNGNRNRNRMTGAALAPSAAGEVTGLVTSGFGPRVHPITGDRRFHTGIDLRAAEGAPIRAAAGGVIVDAGRRGGYGNTVEIDHGNGTTTLYAHASALLVDKGQRVEPGQPVALVGQTGQATGPHLHFEVRRYDHPVDPSSRHVPISIARALNTYRERAESINAGTPSGAGIGDKP